MSINRFLCVNTQWERFFSVVGRNIKDLECSGIQEVFEMMNDKTLVCLFCFYR